MESCLPETFDSPSRSRDGRSLRRADRRRAGLGEPSPACARPGRRADRSPGSFDEITSAPTSSYGHGQRRAGARVCCGAARGGATWDREQQLISRHGEEMWARRAKHGVQLRLEAGGRRRRAVIRVLKKKGRRAHRPRVRHVTARRTSSVRDGAHGEGSRRAGRGAAARLRRGRPTEVRQRRRRGREDGDPRAAGVRPPVHSTRCTTWASRHPTATSSTPRVRPGAQADRNSGEASARRSACACTGLHVSRHIR